MYSTCLFCHSALGKNEAIEHFPVGRRLAFDEAKGRLWVVCSSCERWNLTPIEERWEAIEECERAFRDTKLRVSTDNVGLARLREGITLVRIGAPQRPELAAWRYGDQFGRRRRKHVIMTSTVIAAAGGLVIAGPFMGLISASAVNLLNVGSAVDSFRAVARINVEGTQYRLNRKAIARVALRRHGQTGFELEIPYMIPWKTAITFAKYGGAAALRSNPSLTLLDDDALRAARTLLPRINSKGGAVAAVRDAVDLLEATPQPDRLFARAAQASERRRGWSALPSGSISTLPAAQRLALEMVLHEEDERRALEGELATLEERWREAEEIAAISDDMFLPAGIVDRLRRV